MPLPPTVAADDMLSALGFQDPANHVAAAAWAASLQGRDSAVSAQPALHSVASVPPGLVRLTSRPALWVLVVAPSAAAPLFESQISQWASVSGITMVTPGCGLAQWPELGSVAVGTPATLLPHLSSAEPPSSLCDSLLLVLLGADDMLQFDEKGLRNLLMLLPQPQQTTMLVETWSQAARVLASEILLDPLSLCLSPPSMPVQLPAPSMSQEPLVSKVGSTSGKSKARLEGNKLVRLFRNGKYLLQCTVRKAGSVQRALEIGTALCELADHGASLEDLLVRKRELLEGTSGTTSTPLLPQKRMMTAGDADMHTELANAQSSLPNPGIDHLNMLGKYMANIVCRSANAEFREAVLAVLPEAQEGVSAARLAGSKEAEEHAIREGVAALLASQHDVNQPGGGQTEFGCTTNPSLRDECAIWSEDSGSETE